MRTKLGQVIALITATVLPSISHATNCYDLIGKADLLISRGDTRAALQELHTAYKFCNSNLDVLEKLIATCERGGSPAQCQPYRTALSTLQNARTGMVNPKLTTESPLPETADIPSIVRDKWALIVGIGKFEDQRIPELTLTPKDARDVEAALLNPNYGRFRNDGQHVLTLIDQQATTTAIKSAIDDLAKKAAADDLVVLYISTHGTPASMDDIGQKQVLGYVVTHDSKIDALYATALPMKLIEEAISSRIRAKRVVAFLDTCFSADTMKYNKEYTELRGAKALVLGGNAGASLASSLKVTQPTGRVVITSSRDSEESWESEKAGNSYFTLYLLHGLQKKAGLLSIKDIYEQFLKDPLTDAVKLEKHREQHAVFGWYPDKAKDIIIGVPVN